MSSNFSKKVEELEEEISKCVGNTTTKCIPTSVIIGAIIPFILALVFYFGQPWFVKKKEGDKDVRDPKKILMYVIILTIVCWLAMYWYLKGFSNLSMVCKV